LDGFSICLDKELPAEAYPYENKPFRALIFSGFPLLHSGMFACVTFFVIFRTVLMSLLTH